MAHAADSVPSPILSPAGAPRTGQFDDGLNSRIDDLLVLGITAAAALQLPTIELAPIETDEEFWQPAEHGPEAVIVPVFDCSRPSFLAPRDDVEPIDQMAFFGDRPDRWWWRTGCADMLGDDTILSSHIWGLPVRIVADPLAWLRAGGSAVCLLYPEAALKLISVPELICDDLELAERIDRLLRRPPAAMPLIRVTEAAA